MKPRPPPGEVWRARLQEYVPRKDRVDLVAGLAVKWANLRLKPNGEKRIAIILSNYPTKDARIGNAVGLDTPASIIHILHALQDAGYHVEDIPGSGDVLVHRIIERCSNDVDSLTEEQLRLAVGHVTGREYDRWFQGFPGPVKTGASGSLGRTTGPGFTGPVTAWPLPGFNWATFSWACNRPGDSAKTPSPSITAPDLAPTHH